MKKHIPSILLIITIIFTSFGSIAAGAVGATTGEVDVVFLVDSSKSMDKSDPERIRLEAMSLFADLCSLGNTKMGFVLFGSDINYSQAPIAIDTEADRDKIKETVSGLDKVSGSTDIGRAVKYAAEMLASDEYTGKGKFIVLLSDGKTVISGNGDRTIEDSEVDLKSGIIAAQNAGIPIYTIGLNANGDVDVDQLAHISSSTYADAPYMTDSASDLSEILSDIYVRHTGAEAVGLAEFVSDGGYTDTPFDIPDNSVVEANIVIMHTAGAEDIKLYGPDGNEVPDTSEKVSIQPSHGYTLVKIYYPDKGMWNLSLMSPENTLVKINYILTRDYNLNFTVYTDKAVGSGARLKFSAVLNGLDGSLVTDENVIGRLSGKVIVKNSNTGEVWEPALSNDKNNFTGEFVIATEGSYTVQASLYNSNIDIRSDITMLDAASEDYIEPEGPLKIILICAGAAAVIGIAAFIIIKKINENVKMWSGRLVITANKEGMPTPPVIYDFAKKVPGRRKVMLSEIMKDAFGNEEAELLIPRLVTSTVGITMAPSGDIRIAKVKSIDYNGGITLGNNVIVGSGTRVTLHYKKNTADERTTIVIQYRRT